MEVLKSEQSDARKAIKKWDEFIENTAKILLAYGTKDQKEISVSSRGKTKKLMQEAVAEIKATFRKQIAAEIVIAKLEKTDEFNEVYKAIIKDDLG